MLHLYFLIWRYLKLAKVKRVRGSRCPSVFTKCLFYVVLLPAAHKNSDSSKAALGASNTANSKCPRCFTNISAWIHTVTLGVSCGNEHGSLAMSALFHLFPSRETCGVPKPLPPRVPSSARPLIDRVAPLSTTMRQKDSQWLQRHSIQTPVSTPSDPQKSLSVTEQVRRLQPRTRKNKI